MTILMLKYVILDYQKLKSFVYILYLLCHKKFHINYLKLKHKQMDKWVHHYENHLNYLSHMVF